MNHTLPAILFPVILVLALLPHAAAAQESIWMTNAGTGGDLTGSGSMEGQPAIALEKDTSAGSLSEGFAEEWVVPDTLRTPMRLPVIQARAAEGNPDAQLVLGMIYGRGDDVPQDYAEAFKWFSKAAEQGNSHAQYLLVKMYREGLGVPKDNAEAIRWLRKAAAQGLVRAQLELGQVYHQGEMTPRDYAEALKWYLRAAEQGQSIAQLNAGLMYEKGQGGEKDYIQAYKWFGIAAGTFGEIGAKARVQRIMVKLEMTPEQIAEAQQLISEFTPQQEETHSLEKTTN
jgi:hypothetical protein